MTIHRAEAPCRVDLAGGTLDLWPLSQLVDEATTINVAIDVTTGCSITPGGRTWTFRARESGEFAEFTPLPRRPERSVAPGLVLAAVTASHFDLPPCAIETFSQAGRGSGLGGSSSLVVSLVAAAAAATDRDLGDADLVELACNLETRVLGLPGGCQDHWAAVRGGMTILEFGPEGARATSGPPGATVLAEGLVVADTRVQHHSGMNNWTVFRAFLEGDGETRSALAAVADAARALRAALDEPDPVRQLEAARAAMADEWSARRRLSPAVTSPEVDEVVAAAASVGGAAKVCGAGGGGCVVALPGPGGRDELVRALRGTRSQVLEVRPRAAGVRVETLPGP